MRATRNAGKNTPPAAKKAGKVISPKVAAVEKQEQELIIESSPAAGEVTAVGPATREIKQEGFNVNGEAKALKVEEKLAAPAKKKVNTPKQKAEEEAYSGRQESVEETAVVQKEVCLKEDILPNDVTGDETELSDPEDEAPAEMKVEELEEEEDMTEEEVEDAEEEVEEEEEQGEGVENEDEEMEEEEEAEEVEEVEEVEEREEAEEEEEEEVEVEEEVEELEEEVEELEEEEDHEAEGEEELLEQRPVSERQKRKKFEVFVGGLDKDATEDDVRKAFEGVGEVVEIRLMRHPQTGKNKGYAFVRFATIDQAKRAATELERTKIRDKECGVVPSEDNDTLFIGNISKSWKKEQVLEKLKEYGVEGVEEITLMTDSKNEELNRGYAFLELATHTDAVKAFVRLSKPDAIFGSDRSAKVAWAEPFFDEEVLAKVKSVFVDGVPSTWDESKVKEHFGKYGQIERIVLAKNNPKSKRHDYAFVNYAARESAVACVEALKDEELADGDNKVKVKVALSKPVPRKKHIKGSRGGYPIGGRPSGRGRVGWAPLGGSFGIRRGRGGRGFFRGGRIGRGGGRRPYDEPRFIRALKQHVVDERPFPDERPKIRPPPRGAVLPRPSRGAPRGPYSRREEINHVRRPSHEYSSQRIRGSSFRRGRGGPYRDDYAPRGARLSPGLPRSRSYSGRPVPREDAYPRRPDRGHAYDRDVDGGYGSGAPDYAEAGPGIKRPYATLDESAAYYESGHRGYPRARVDYADPGPAGGSHYSESVRAPLGRSSLGGRSAMPPVGGGSMPQASVPIYDQPGSGSLYGSGGHGYSSVMSGGSDYVSGAGEVRGGSYNSPLYGGRTQSGYGLPGSGSGSYY